MNSTQVLDLINNIGNISGKNDKEAMLMAAAGDDVLRNVLEYAYNPFKRYGIRKRPETIGEHSINEFDAGTWELLDDLISRRLTGNAAIEAVRGEMTALNKDSAELLWRIIKKDMRAGFSDETCNKVWKGLLPTFPYMRCSLPKKAKWDKWNFASGCYSQKKADGMFANINLEGGEVSIISRQGSEFPIEGFPAEFVADLKKALVSNMQHHGELLVKKDGKILPREIGNGMLNSVLNGGDFDPGCTPLYEVWDCIPLTAVIAKGKYNTPYCDRFNLLNAVTEEAAIIYDTDRSVRVIETKIIHSLEEAFVHYAEKLGGGEEGVIVKSRDAIWKDGTSTEQIKLKLEVDVDLKIVAIQEGKEGTKNEGRPGAFSCETADHLLQVDVTVKNEALRDQVEANPDDFIGKIIAVRANQVLKPSASNDFHSLFLPRMVEAGYHTDKSQADTLQGVVDQFEAAIAA